MLTLLLSLAFAGDPVDDAVVKAVAHPSITSATQLSSAAEHRARVAGSWADPVLAVELSNLPASTLGLTHPMSGLQLKLSQKLSLWGTSSALRDVDHLKMQAASYRADEQALRVETGVRSAWVRAASAYAVAEVTAAHRVRVVELQAVAARHYEVGHGGQSALLRLSVLEQRLADEEAQWLRQAAVHEAWLSEATGEPVTVTDRPELVLPAGTAESWAAAIDARPAVQALIAEAESEDTGATATRRQGIPQPTVWAGYRVRTAATDGADLVSVGLSAPLPVASARRTLLRRVRASPLRFAARPMRCVRPSPATSRCSSSPGAARQSGLPLLGTCWCPRPLALGTRPSATTASTGRRSPMCSRPRSPCSISSGSPSSRPPIPSFRRRCSAAWSE